MHWSFVDLAALVAVESVVHNVMEKLTVYAKSIKPKTFDTFNSIHWKDSTAHHSAFQEDKCFKVLNQHCHFSEGELNLWLQQQHVLGLNIWKKNRSCPSLRSNDLLLTSWWTGLMSPYSGSSNTILTGRGHLLSPRGQSLAPCCSHCLYAVL